MDRGACARARNSGRLMAGEARSSSEVCETIVGVLHEAVRFRWCAVMSTDPDTLLPSGGVVEGFSPTDCGPFWDNELTRLDVNKFADLARRVEPVATLAASLDGDLERSPRYRELYAPLGAADELRVAFVSGASCLAVGVFLRDGEDGPFSAEDTASVRELAPVATRALRQALASLSPEERARAPVVIVLDADDRIVGTSPGGREVLDELRVEGVDGEFPGIVQAAVTKARHSRTSANVTTRLRARTGHWMRLHVAPMDEPEGSVAVTVEAARPDDLVGVLLDSYGLTPRETEIVLRLCRGLTSKEIAEELIISAHTVRDHVKSIYDKANVRGRGELVATLFSNHVLERFHDTVSHVAPAS